MQLVVGTYERFLLGYKLPEELEDGGQVQLSRSFTYAAHQGPVRCLAAGGPWLVSGGQDDQLHIYDVKAGKDLGFMMNPGDGAITCVQLFTPAGAVKPTHLLSGSDDGSIAIWQAGGDWEALKLLKGHKGPIRGLSVHPSGLLAVSVGHDRLLKLWNLSKGRCSYTARLEVEADDVAFSADGESYALLCDKVISLHTVSSEGGLVAKLTHTRRVTAMLLPTPNIAAAAAAGSNAAAVAAAGSNVAAVVPLLLCGLDDGRLCLWDVRKPDGPVWELEKAHNTRIRAITALQQGAPGQLPTLLATASSDGVVKVWDSSNLAASSSSSSSDRLVLLGSVSTNGRVTGMVLSAPEQAAAAAAAAAADGTAAGKGELAAVKKQKKKKKQAHQQQQQQQQQKLQVQAKGVQKPSKSPKQQQQQQKQQKTSSKGVPSPKQKQQRQQKQQKQQQQGGGDDPGFEVVPAPGGSSPKPAAAAAAAAAAAGCQQRQQKQGTPSQKQQKQKHKQQQQLRDDGALVPRVTTTIKKKQRRPGKQGVGAAVAKGRAAAAGKGKGKSTKPSSRRA